MKAFWGDKAIIVIGLKAGTAYQVEIQNSWLKKMLKADNCGYLKVKGTAKNPLPSRENIQVGSRVISLNTLAKVPDKSTPKCRKVQGKYVMESPQAGVSFYQNGTLYVQGFQPGATYTVGWRGLNQTTKKASKGGILIIAGTKSQPVDQNTKIAINGQLLTLSVA